MFLNVFLLHFPFFSARERGVDVTPFADQQLSWSVCSPACARKGGSWRGVSAESASPPSPRFIVTPVDAEGSTERDSPSDPIRDSLGSIPAASASHSGNPSSFSHYSCRSFAVKKPGLSRALQRSQRRGQWPTFGLLIAIFGWYELREFSLKGRL
ncbi:hypothetical protein Y032_0017g3412 [Ancylostoma ceylanicum]|uniref:Uncharacterized protein n=1 Tax=Ancylostoma ceylanicum TaxID=53326 RepID=A0A016V4I2_9BILA|nr:hypothetical protein Y032_0017g3412 [Ancylostoma ceylanicum]